MKNQYFQWIVNCITNHFFKWGLPISLETFFCLSVNKIFVKKTGCYHNDWVFFQCKSTYCYSIFWESPYDLVMILLTFRLMFREFIILLIFIFFYPYITFSNIYSYINMENVFFFFFFHSLWHTVKSIIRTIMSTESLVN